jgi:hypothetical protein
LLTASDIPTDLTSRTFSGTVGIGASNLWLFTISGQDLTVTYNGTTTGNFTYGGFRVANTNDLSTALAGYLPLTGGSLPGPSPGR